MDQLPAKTPEQIQLENIAASIECVCYAISVLRKEPLTVANIQRTHGTVAWLENIEGSLRKDYADVGQRLPKQPQVPLTEPQEKRTRVQKKK